MRRLLAVLALLLVVVPAASGEVRLRVLPPVAGLSVKATTASRTRPIRTDS